MRRLIQSWAMYAAMAGALMAGAFGTPAWGGETGNESLLGTWQGKLIINPSTQLTLQFIVARDAQNKYAAVLNAPEEANLQNVAVNSFALTDGKVVFSVDEVNGKYDGTLKDKKITGKWKQNGSAFDLVLVPVVKAKIPAETVAQLDGPWNGVLSLPQLNKKLNIVLHFKADNASENGVSATIDCPDQALSGIPVDSVTLQNGTLHVKVLRPKMGYTGRLVGSQLVGNWNQDGDTPLTLNKGNFHFAGLAVEKSIREKINGDWYGRFSNGVGMSLKFKDDKNGSFDAFLDSPYEGRINVPINAISMNGSNITIRIDGVDATFSGSLTQNAIDGKFVVAGGQARNITFARGEYVPEAVHMPSELANKLVGTWVGKTANTYMILRFQLNAQGDLVALQDIPNRRLMSLPISDVTLKGEDLSLIVKGISAEFKGKVSKNEITGNWTMPSLQFPLTLGRSVN